MVGENGRTADENQTCRVLRRRRLDGALQGGTRRKVPRGHALSQRLWMVARGERGLGKKGQRSKVNISARTDGTSPAELRQVR